MSVRQKNNGRWEARWAQSGRKPGKTFDRKRDAEAYEREMIRRVSLGGLVPIPSKDVTLDAFVKVFWREHVGPNLADSTAEVYALIWAKHLFPRVGHLGLREFGTDAAYALKADLDRDPEVGAATARKALGLLQSILAHAKRKGRVDANVLIDVKPPAYEREREPHIFTPADVEAIRVQLVPRSRVLVAILAYAGPRPEEALRLTWADVGPRAIRFRDTKRKRQRLTPLIAPLADDLAEWRGETDYPDEHHPVIPNLSPCDRGKPWTTSVWRNRRRRTWQTVAPPGSRPRDLRSSFITLRAYEGVPLSAIAKEVGTSVAMIDKHYAGIWANWDGVQRPADEMIRAARTGEQKAGIASA